MADIFGDKSLFMEFERPIVVDNAKKTTKNADQCSSLASCSESNIRSSSDSHDVATSALSGDSSDGIATMSVTNDPSSRAHIEKLENEIKRLKTINSQLQHQIRLIIPDRSCKPVDSPAFEVLYMNHDHARRYKSDVDRFLADIMSKPVRDNLSKLPNRPNFVHLTKSEETKDKTQAEKDAMVIGSCHYYKGFATDTIGWPLVEYNPSLSDGWDISKYEQVYREAFPCSDDEDEGSSLIIKKEKRPKNCCFNCGGDHNMNLCQVKRDQKRINLARKEFMDKCSPSTANQFNKQRYHIEDDPRFSKMKPGEISDNLRQALGISPVELPPYIYQMRVLGVYPPGHLENAKQQTTSGLAMFGKHGIEVTTDNEMLEDGELNENRISPKLQYDVSKLIDYPGFNVEVPAGTIDKCRDFNMPPLQPRHLKANMIASLKSMFQTNSNESKILGKRSFGDNSSVGQGQKQLKRDSDAGGDGANPSVDMDLDDTGDDDLPVQHQLPPQDTSSSMLAWMYAPPPPPPPPLPEPEELPPLPPSPDSPSEAPDRFLSELPAVQSAAEPEQDIVFSKNATNTLIHQTSTLELKISDSNPGILSDSPQSPPAVNTPLPSSTVTPIVVGNSVSFSLGTPIGIDLEESSGINDLPDSAKFAAGISEHINFDNLPNSTGTFGRLRQVLSNLRSKF